MGHDAGSKGWALKFDLTIVICYEIVGYMTKCTKDFIWLRVSKRVSISATHGIQLGVSIEPEEDLKSAINIKSLERKNAEMPLCIL